MPDIIYRGLRKVGNMEIRDIKTQSEKEFKKIKREIKGNKNAKLFIDVHKAEKAGNRYKYSIHLRVECPTILLTASHADFDLLRALHRAYDNIKTETTHKFKRENTPRRTKRF